MVIEIQNDAGNQFDNYYVKFVSDSNADTGVWTETVQPALENDFDTSTPEILADLNSKRPAPSIEEKVPATVTGTRPPT